MTRSWQRHAHQRTCQEPGFLRLILLVSPERSLLHEIGEQVKPKEQPGSGENADRVAVKSVERPRMRRCKRRCNPIPLTRVKLDREGQLGARIYCQTPIKINGAQYMGCRVSGRSSMACCAFCSAPILLAAEVPRYSA
ncbi:MAG: hypothetical protein DKINENOH_03082 [bacterium]|nr:hypothetical protein [bacterium]